MTKAQRIWNARPAGDYFKIIAPQAIITLKVIIMGGWKRNYLLFFFFFFFVVFTNKSLWHSPFRTVDLEVTKRNGS